VSSSPPVDAGAQASFEAELSAVNPPSAAAAVKRVSCVLRASENHCDVPLGVSSQPAMMSSVEKRLW
jgi:hypothetical protein